MNNKLEFCPECGIGLNNREIKVCHCQNCKANWYIQQELEHDCNEHVMTEKTELPLEGENGETNYITIDIKYCGICFEVLSADNH